MKGRRTEANRRFAELRAIPLFAEATDEEAARIDNMATEAKVAAGQVLTREGEGGLEFVLILEGRARVSRGEAVLAELGPGDFLGEMALLEGTPRGATATALEPMRVLVFNAGEFAGLLDEVPAVRRRIVEAAEHRRSAAE